MIEITGIMPHDVVYMLVFAFFLGTMLGAVVAITVIRHAGHWKP